MAGIGGATIEEAKERLSYAEAMQWAEYIRLRGSLNIGMRMEHGFALIAMVLSRVNRGKAEMIDFMPHFDKPEASIEDVFNLLRRKHGGA